MLMRGNKPQVLAVNADNAASNDTQMAKLSKLDNSFEADNRVWCFNHTMQLAAKALLLRPLNPDIISDKDKDKSGKEDNDCPPLILNDEETEAEDKDKNDNHINDDVADDPNDEIDKLQMLDNMERNTLLNGTLTIRDAIT